MTLVAHEEEPSSPLSLIIKVCLSPDRCMNGDLSVYDDSSNRLLYGPVEVLSCVDRNFAGRYHNREVDFRKPFGDIPTGEFKLVGLAHRDMVALPSDENTGPHQVMVFQAVNGDAALAEPARGALLLHGGPFEASLGTLRLRDQDQQHLIDFILSAHQVRLTVDNSSFPLHKAVMKARLILPKGDLPPPPPLPEAPEVPDWGDIGIEDIPWPASFTLDQ